MKFLVVCVLLLITIVALSMQQSEGFFNASIAIPTRVAVSACLSGNIVILKAKTTDNSTITNVFLVHHSSKNAVGPEEFTDQILVRNGMVTPTETSIATIPLSQMTVGKKYYVIQVTTPTDSNAMKYQGNTVITSRNTLLGVFTYAQPSACPVAAPVAAPAAPAAAPTAAPAAPAAAPTAAPAAAPTAAPTAAPPAAPAPPAAIQARTFDRQEPSRAAISETSEQAKNLKQRMDILSDVQSLLKRKTLEKRRRPSVKCPREDCDGECHGDCDGECHGNCHRNNCNGNCNGNGQGNESPSVPLSAALSQGREYKKACDHDMSQYIRKDSIPCWKCNLDY